MIPLYSRSFLAVAGRWLGLLALAALLPAGAARAQQPVIRRIYETEHPSQDSLFRLGNNITVEVTGLNRWLKLQERILVAQGLDPQKAHARARNLVLYVDDAPILNLPPVALYVDESTADSVLTAAAQRRLHHLAAHRDSAAAVAGFASPLSALLDEYPIGVPDKVIFKLARTVDNYAYWNIVSPSPWAPSFTGKLGIGYEDRIFTQLHPRREASALRIQQIDLPTLWVGVLGTLGLAVGLLVLGARSWLLRVTLPRDRPTEPLPTLAAAHPPFSIGKVQVAWWTFLILGSILVIYCASGEMPVVSTTSLALLGLSGGTAALNGLIKRDPPPVEAATGPWLTSRGWLTDILSDAHGLSINRLQQVVISALMGYFFVRTVYNSVAMPVWTDNQVLLLGVSNATFLGLEWQGSRTTTKEEKKAQKKAKQRQQDRREDAPAEPRPARGGARKQPRQKAGPDAPATDDLAAE